MLTNARYFSQATWCILIGVNNYSSAHLPDLRSPQNDVGTLRKSLINPEGCAIPAKQVLEIAGANGQVSKADATDILDMLTPSIGKDDLLILFFAGHGITQDDDFVLCFSDTDLENTPRTAITGTELDQRLNQIKCRGVLVILDCCQGAGFAEFAPRYFRSLGESDFRILLTSTKTNELSWEGLKGTFFTQFLVEAIEGKNIVTENPGLIHFSELLRFIQDRLFEVKEADRMGGVSQTPVFAGVYPKDPLIFVNRKITLEGIAIKTTRYTKEYIRRVIARGVLSLLVTAFIFFGMWYTVLDKTEYAEVKGGYWAVYKGKAGINAFGFPKLIRETDIPENAVQPVRNAYPKYFESELGKPVQVKLGNSLQPIHKAIFLMWAHQTDSAKLLLKEYFKSGNFDINAGAAIGLYASIAAPKDSSDFISFLNNPRIQDRSSVALGMLKSCPSSLNMLLRSNKLLNSKDIHRTILFNLGLVDSSMAGRMIRNIIATKTYTDDNGDIYAGAMSAGVILKPAEIYQLINENFDSSTENAAMYSNFTGQQNVLANYIVGRLTMALITGHDQAPYVKTLGIFNISRGLFDPRAFFTRDDNLQLQEAAVFSAIKEKIIGLSQIPDPLKHDIWLKIRLAKAGLISARDVREILSGLDYNRIDIGAISTFLTAVRNVTDRSSTPYLLKLLQYQDPNDISTDVYIPAMKILTRLKYRPDLAGQYLNYPNDQIKTQAYDWYFEYRPEKIMDMLIAKLAQEQEDFFVAVFNDLHPDSASLERIAGIGKNGNSQERHNAAAIIALQGNYGQVVETLRSPDRDVRETCIKYIAANPLFPQLALNFKSTFPGPEEIQIKQAAVSLKTIKKLANTGSVELNRWVIKLLTSWSNSDEGIKKALDLNGY